MPPSNPDPHPISAGWNHNIAYHGRILRSLPVPCSRALDIGCGEGTLTRLLAPHCGTVTGIDLDPEVIAIAASHPASPPNTTFVQGDAMSYPFPQASFDFIAVVATLHHLPLEAALKRFKSLLAPGGVLAILGLYRAHTVADHLYAAAALPASRLLRTVRPWAGVKVRIREPHENLAVIRAGASSLLPGSILRRHLFFRYTLLWQKPRSAV